MTSTAASTRGRGRTSAAATHNVAPSFDDIVFDLTPPMLAPAGPSDRLTVRQQERLRSVLRLALELADRGGDDAVKMRDLSEGGVAFRTIYRYFGSRDFVVFRATSAWCDAVAVHSIPAEDGRDFRTRSLAQFAQLTAHWEAHPRLVEAWLRSATSDDPYVQGFQRAHPPSVLATQQWSAMDDFDPDYALRLRSMIEAHAFGGMVRWVHGQRTLAELRHDFAELLTLVFEPPEWRASG